jgi:NAD(P)-dependent dehydrogenase (short-subunit alcohol dehydrogenase family)
MAGFGLAAATAVLVTDPPFSFRGASVAITGGSRGLGLALAKELVQQGALVTLLARDGKELDRARALLVGEYHLARVHTIICDVTETAQVHAALEETVRVFGNIDVLINNAGAIVVAPYETLTREDFEAQMDLHLYSAMTTTEWVLPHFLRNKKGRIINICSMGGKVAVPHMLPYDTSKFALAGFSQGLSAELERHNICVTTVYPTLMHTGSPIQAVFKGDYEKEYEWFATGDNFPGLSQPAAVAARKILRACRDGQRELIPTTLGKARMGLGVIFPETAMALMALMNRLMPRGLSRTYHTGAESRGRLDKTILGRLLKGRTARVEQDLNQQAKESAKENMGLLH